MKLLSLVLVVSALGCLREGGANPQVRAEPMQPSQTAVAQAPAAPSSGSTARHFGEAITMSETTRLPDLMRNSATLSGRTIRTEGVVTAVCQARGCWMEIRDESAQVHIRMHGHSFFIPRDAQGRQARVQATVIAANPQGHCEQEAAEQTGQPVATLELDATGVDIL